MAHPRTQLVLALLVCACTHAPCSVTLALTIVQDNLDDVLADERAAYCNVHA